jgi:hypothetical protein
MNLLLYRDRSITLDLKGVSSYLMDLGISSVKPGQAKFEVPGPSVRFPQTYDALPVKLLGESKLADLALCATRLPYDNNFFFHYSGNLAIVSFYAWEQLTALPQENGLVYFVAKLLRNELPLPDQHRSTTGCLNDFLWDKTGIDTGMRAGRICEKCEAEISRHKLTPDQREVRGIVNRILDDLGRASPANRSVLDPWKLRKSSVSSVETDVFDVFLCHNSQDKPDVKPVATRLKREGVRVWLDDEQLRPGLPWQVALERQIQSINAAAVFVGSSGIGPWQDMEMRAFLSEFVRRQCPVIPVILKSVGAVPELPIFLRQMTWVDYREGEESATNRLVWGITGRRAQT